MRRGLCKNMKRPRNGAALLQECLLTQFSVFTLVNQRQARSTLMGMSLALRVSGHKPNRAVCPLRVAARRRTTLPSAHRAKCISVCQHSHMQKGICPVMWTNLCFTARKTSKSKMMFLSLLQYMMFNDDTDGVHNRGKTSKGASDGVNGYCNSKDDGLCEVPYLNHY